MDIASVFKRYAMEGTGQLALKFADLPHLCKISIEDGEAVFIKSGLLSPEETLQAISGKTLLEANFIQGFKPRKRLPQPVTEQLIGLESADSPNNLMSTTEASVISSGRFVSAKNISIMINHYVDIIGPLGVVMMENYMKALGYTQGQEINSNSYNDLLDKLLVDLPEGVQNEFILKHK